MHLSRLALVVPLVLATGCVTLGNFETAHAIGAGQTQIGLEPSAWGAVGGGLGFTGLPDLAVSARYGVNDTTELGFRLGTNGGDLMSKFVLSGGQGRTTLALAPSLGGAFFAANGVGAGLGMVQVPLLIGLPLGDHELVLSPKIHDIFIFGGDTGGGAGANVLSVGAGVGISFHLGPTFQVMPELTILKPLTAGAAGGGQTGSLNLVNTSGLLVQFGVGLLFGGH